MKCLDPLRLMSQPKCSHRCFHLHQNLKAKSTQREDPCLYRIYSMNRPGRLLNFWTLRMGAYSRCALIRGWALIKFSLFSASEVCLFCNKTINANNKTRRSNKARFLYNTLKKTPSSEKCLISIYSLKWVWWG